jgi:hypothetical protein
MIIVIVKSLYKYCKYSKIYYCCQLVPGTVFVVPGTKFKNIFILHQHLSLVIRFISIGTKKEGEVYDRESI